MNKKGNINQLFPAVLALILVGALLFVGILVMSNFQDTTYLNTAMQSANETLGGASTAGVTLAVGHNARAGVCGAVTGILNGTTGSVAIPISNITQVGCVVHNSTDWLAKWGVQGANVRYTYPYTYDAATVTTNAIGSVNTSIGTLATTWLPIIVVVIAAGIVLGILLGAFGGKRK